MSDQYQDKWWLERLIGKDDARKADRAGASPVRTVKRRFALAFQTLFVLLLLTSLGFTGRSWIVWDTTRGLVPPNPEDKSTVVADVLDSTPLTGTAMVLSLVNRTRDEKLTPLRWSQRLSHLAARFP